MKKIILLLIISAFFASCKSSKRVVTKKTRTSKTSKKRNSSPSASTPKTVVNIIDYAKTFEGTRYKYGGLTKKGMDCSGLIYTAFKEENVTIPRVSSAMATTGDWIDLKKVRKGDLLFFATKKNNRSINHVGLVTNTKGDNVEFIHATTSRGVMTSMLKEKYWYFAFVQARRVL